MERFIEYLIGLVEVGEDYLDSLGDLSPDEIAAENTTWEDNDVSTARGRIVALFQSIGQILDPTETSRDSTPHSEQGGHQNAPAEQPVRRPTRKGKRTRVNCLFFLSFCLFYLQSRQLSIRSMG